MRKCRRGKKRQKEGGESDRDHKQPKNLVVKTLREKKHSRKRENGKAREARWKKKERCKT